MLVSLGSGKKPGVSLIDQCIAINLPQSFNLGDETLCTSHLPQHVLFERKRSPVACARQISQQRVRRTTEQQCVRKNKKNVPFANNVTVADRTTVPDPASHRMLPSCSSNRLPLRVVELRSCGNASGEEGVGQGFRCGPPKCSLPVSVRLDGIVERMYGDHRRLRGIVAQA